MPDQLNTLIDVSAPGSGILSTLNAGTAGPGAESYASYNGTSMASPHVAGVAALIRQLNPGLPQGAVAFSDVAQRPVDGPF